MACNLDELNEKIWPIFRARIEALQEVNSHIFEKNQYPDGFKPATENTDGPLDTLVKTTLIVQALIEKGVQFEKTPHGIISELSYDENFLTELKNKYQLVKNDWTLYNDSKYTYGYSEVLIDELLTAYYRDVKQGIIDKNGKILNPSEIHTSAVFNTVQNSWLNGQVQRARATITKYGGIPPKLVFCKTYE